MAVTGAKARRSGVRDVARRAIQAEIAAKAMELFLTKGFEETTVNEIAAAVGISGRSIFRYFDSKEDMVVGELIELGTDVAAALEHRPVDEHPWTALRHALQICVDSLEGQELGLRRATMLANTPSLRTAMLDKQLRWQQMLVPHVAERLPEPRGGEPAELRARGLVSAALSCLDVAATAWTEAQGGRPLTDLVDLVFAAVRS
ncbi:TetR/AcrR family transcriptional regulator [Streptomyces sp. NPDC002159]